jgi:signal transduction histidine kinase
MSQVIHEYHILREVVFQVIEEKKTLSKRERDIILSSIEAASNSAATEFSLALTEAQDLFMSGIVHDLKTPVTSAKAGADLILRSNRPDLSPVLAERISGQMKSMSSMLDRILDASRIRAGVGLDFPREKCNLEDIVLSVVSDLKLVHGDWFIVDSEGPIFGTWNKEYLRRVLENLLGNAVKFRLPETFITISIKRTGESCTVGVHNLGRAIPPEEQKELFRVFRRLKTGDKTKGWGLGLTFVKGVVESLGGSVSVQSSPDKGTTFSITLPIGNQKSD